MSHDKLSIESTENVRQFMLGKNLHSSYLWDGKPISPPFGVQQPGDQAYLASRMQNVPDQPTVSEVAESPLTKLFLDNKYGPAGGYNDVQLIDVTKVLPREGVGYVSDNTVSPKTFVSSEYTPAEILDTVNITNGIVNTVNSKILDDSNLMGVSSGWLRQNLGEIQKQYLDQISDGPKGNYLFDISVTPGKKELKGTDFLSRINNQYDGSSELPGYYFYDVFVPDINTLSKNGISTSGQYGNIEATANAISNLITGGNDIPRNLTANPEPSEKFIEHMGFIQQSKLFELLNYNINRPDYSRARLHQGVAKLLPYQYVGSKSSNPSTIDSPIGAIPYDEFGREVNALVYGPSTLAKELETVDGNALWKYYNFGLNGLGYMDGGDLSGGFSWFGLNSFASTNAPQSILYTRSFTIPKRKGGLLDETQKLINAAPLMGGARRKHAGHAIDQTSKVFNDGYKDISKGSGVRYVDDGLFGTPEYVADYCRTWTKDNPYYKMSNLQSYKGNTRGVEGSVLTNTFNLNIAPVFDVNVDTTKTEKNVKKYMFSIENLAWRGTPELLGLPTTEKGPNGGRVMWFPPYDISIGDTNSAQWNSVSFLGRPEPVYTYNYTERIGTLSFKMVVDHPSVLNEIAQNTLKNSPSFVADKSINAFIAGCKEYDIYELAAVYPNLSIADIITLQNDITDATDEEAYTQTGTGDNPGPVPPADGPYSTDTDGAYYDAGATASTQGTTNMINQSALTPPGEEETAENAAITNNTQSTEKEKKLNTAAILARMLGEENYFNALKEDDEFIYDSLKRKLKYFHPSFHSMTPEGLNTRLSFLLQCTRPGRTMPTAVEGGEDNVDAENTAFGPPPICVLRVGDFYHTKIAIDSVSFSYEPLVLDMNPEGIGLQPMIANVSMNFKYIGGQGLEKPVSELQNALSNNFFANTEIYNPNSTTTSKTDKTIFDEQAIINELETEAAESTEGGSNGTNSQGGSPGGSPGTNP